jgi:hypothetical protein
MALIAVFVVIFLMGPLQQNKALQQIAEPKADKQE